MEKELEKDPEKARSEARRKAHSCSIGEKIHPACPPAGPLTVVVRAFRSRSGSDWMLINKLTLAETTTSHPNRLTGIIMEITGSRPFNGQASPHFLAIGAYTPRLG